MSYRLWLDDRRIPPWGYDLWAKTVDEAIWMLQNHEIEHVSLDHDLASEHYADAETSGWPTDRSKYTYKTGYAVIEWMRDSGTWVADIGVHTRRETAAEEMLGLIARCAPAGVSGYRVKLKRI